MKVVKVKDDGEHMRIYTLPISQSPKIILQFS